MRLPQRKKHNRILIGLALVIFLFQSDIYSQESLTKYIQVDVKIAVCGNSIVESIEDCEPLIYENISCLDYGYEGEDILCDSSCSYDFSQCIIPEPPDPVEEIDDSIFEETIEEYIPSIVVRQSSNPTVYTYPYPFLEIFDLNGNGKIDSNEFVSSVKLWGEYWKMYRVQQEELDNLICDLNEDGKCDIVDLSILMYHRR